MNTGVSMQDVGGGGGGLEALLRKIFYNWRI